MSSLGSPNPFFIAGKKAYEIERSLRFNDGDSPSLTRSPSGDGNKQTFTFSWWQKITQPDGYPITFSVGSTSLTTGFWEMRLGSLGLYLRFKDSSTVVLNSNAKFRDPSAWYHCVIAVDTTKATNNERIRFYVNGVQLTSFENTNYPSQNFSFRVNTTDQHQWGYGKSSSGAVDGPLDSYLAEINFIDGSQYDPSYFGETNAITGQWNPKKYTGGYGTNGYYLNFSDNSGTTATTLGKDSSGNGNNFTPNNLVTGDSMPDSPTNNFCTMNPIDKSTDSRLTVTDGNLKVGTSHGFRTARATFGLSSGKWYWEARLITWSDSFIGITDTEENITSTSRGAETSNSAMIRQNNGDIRTGGSNSSYGNSQANGDILGFALDMDNGKFYISENGTFYNSGDPVNGTNAAKTGLTATVSPSASPYDNRSCYFNFGQDDTFDGNETSQGNTDANSLGKFKYAPPTGFLAICSANLPDPTILLPNKHFDTVLYTGTGATLSISSLNFGPDWIWLKRRDSAHSHGLFDSVRGPNKLLYSDLTNSENQYGSLQSFNSDGFTLSTGGEGNTSSASYVAWNWNGGDTDGKTYTVTVVSDSGNKYRFDGFGTSAVTLDLAEGGTYIFNYPAAHPFRFSTTADGTHGGGTEYTTGVTVLSSTSIQIVVAASAPNLNYYCSSHSGMGGAINTNSTLGSSNFDGNAQTTVKVNTTAGFSIVTFTDNYAAGTGTYGLGHGLGVKPAFYVVKSRNHANAWWTWHQEYSNQAQGYQFLNATNALANSVTPWGNSAPDSTKFYIKEGGFNYVDDTFVAYCFSEVAGYSKFGKYTGNGNADGPFVFTSFKPAVIILKNTSTAEDWAIRDIKHSGYTTMNGNPVNIGLRPNTNAGYTGGSNLGMDFLSNGFKLRGPDNDVNKSGDTYIYLAFASSPFKNARAR
mgnify:CR=1 FL=1